MERKWKRRQTLKINNYGYGTWYGCETWREYGIGFGSGYGYGYGTVEGNGYGELSNGDGTWRRKGIKH